MIDHNPQYDQGFRDATATEIRHMRDDMESRYRESQTREKWNQSSADKGSHVSQMDRDKYEEIGAIAERSEKRREAISQIPTPRAHAHFATLPRASEGSVWDILSLIALGGFAFLIFQVVVAL